MPSISAYDEALQFIKQNPGTGGAGSLAKLVLSLYNDLCGFSFAECVGNLDDRLTQIALRMVQDYAAHGETADLLAAGKMIADDLYPRLWEMGLAMRDARQATREKWQADERKAELDALTAAEAALFTDPSKLIPASAAKELLDESETLYAHYHVSGDWRHTTSLTLDRVRTAIDEMGGSELSHNCPDGSSMLVVRIAGQIYYVSTDYDAREAYLDTIQGQRKPIPTTVSVPPRGSQQ